MRFAYADPPYPGCAHLYKGVDQNACEVNHQLLVRHLCEDFPDGWSLSTSSTALKEILGLCPDDVRVMAWVKPFCSFKPGVGVAYAWEPVIFRGGRRRKRQQPTVRDWVSANITLKKGMPGAKPPQFWFWLFDVFNMEPDDQFEDLFPGSCGGAAALAEWRTYRRSLLV